MPSCGRRRPARYRSAEEYLGRIHVYDPYQERLKSQLLAAFSNKETGLEVLQRISNDINAGFFVSRKVLSNSNIYRCFREALESREVRVPVIVPETVAGSFVAKWIIAAIWSEIEHKVTRDSVLIEYDNVRKLVVNTNKDILQRRQKATLRPEPLSDPS